MKLYEIIKEYFISHKDDIIEDFSRMLAVPSPLAKAEKDAPNGIYTKRMLEVAVQMFREKGFDANISEDNLYALVKYGEGKKSIGLFSHGDVVPVDDKWIMTEPFSPKVINGRMFARGACDNKNAIIFGLWLMRGLDELGIKMKNSLTLFVGSNEEAGMNDIEAFAQNEKMPELCIVPDNNYPVSLGEKGRSAVYCRAKKAFSDIKNIFGGEAENILLGEVFACIIYSDALYTEILEKADDRYAVSVVGDELCVVAKGLSAHAAHPEKGKNAMAILCELLCNCKQLCASDREILSGAQKLLATHNAESFGSFCEDGSFGKSTCANGKVSTPDGHLTLSFDIRYGIGLSPETLRSNIEKTLAPIGYAISSFDGSESFEIPRESAHAQALLKAYRDITGEATADFYYSGGGTYAKHLENAFSIGMSRGKADDYDDLPAGHGSEHQPDEFINIDGLIDAMAINSAMILSCDEIL